MAVIVLKLGVGAHFGIRLPCSVCFRSFGGLELAIRWHRIQMALCIQHISYRELGVQVLLNLKPLNPKPESLLSDSNDGFDLFSFSALGASFVHRIWHLELKRGSTHGLGFRA